MKTITFKVLNILQRETDETHTITPLTLLELLRYEYDLKIDRRTLYSSIEELRDNGYKIESYSDNHKGYCLLNRQFDESEVFLMTNALFASNLIPNEDSKKLIHKLLDTQSVYSKDKLNSLHLIDNKNKKDNDQFFDNISIISKAISQFKSISFDYTRYDIYKKLVKRRDRRYHVSPYYLVYKNDTVYLLSKTFNHDDLSIYRLDRMINVETDSSASFESLSLNDPYDYISKHMFMFSGKTSLIKLKCNISVLDNLIDTFGKNIIISRSDGDSFIATLDSSLQGMKYFCLQYLDSVEVLEPKELREEVIKSIDNALKHYTST